jgi:hypothetical protein
MHDQNPVTLEERKALHLLRVHVGTDALSAYEDKFKELAAGWAKIADRVKPHGGLKPETDKAELAAWAGAGKDKPGFLQFEIRWQQGRATVAEMNHEIEVFNAIAATRKGVDPVAPITLPSLTARVDAAHERASLAHDTAHAVGDRVEERIAALEKRFTALEAQALHADPYPS